MMIFSGNKSKCFLAFAGWCGLLFGCGDRSRQEAVQFFERGNYAFRKQEYSQALHFYTEALGKDPALTEARHNRGLTYVQNHQPEQALRDFSEALQQEPAYAPAYQLRGRVLLQLGRPGAALPDLQRAAGLLPDSAGIQADLGQAHYALHQVAAARTAFDAALRTDPQLARAYINRGVLFFEEKQLPQALADWQQALRLSPEEPTLHHNLSLYHAARQDWPKALAAEETALRLRPGRADFLGHRSFVLLHLGRLPEAEADLQAALRQTDPDAYLFRTQGLLLLLKQQPQAALSALLEAERLNPGVAGLYGLLGTAARAAGQDPCRYFRNGAALGDSAAARQLKTCR